MGGLTFSCGPTGGDFVISRINEPAYPKENCRSATVGYYLRDMTPRCPEKRVHEMEKPCHSLIWKQLGRDLFQGVHHKQHGKNSWSGKITSLSRLRFKLALKCLILAYVYVSRRPRSKATEDSAFRSVWSERSGVTNEGRVVQGKKTVSRFKGSMSALHRRKVWGRPRYGGRGQRCFSSLI